MRIAMLIEGWDNVWGGGQKVALEISKTFSKEYGVKVDLFVMNLGNFKQFEKRNKNFRIIRVGKNLQWSFKDRIKWLFLTKKMILNFNKKKKYDVIYCHANLPGFIGKQLSKKLGVPVVYQVHGCGIEAMQQMYGKGLKTQILSFLETYLQRKIKYDLEITVDQNFSKFKNINIPVYIPNGVDLQEFDKVSFSKENNFFKILFVGRLHPQKGLKFLIEAVNILKIEFRKKNVKVVIVGDGEEKPKLLSLIKNYGLGDLFVFEGRKSGIDLIRQYKSSSLFVLPSLFEGLPLTILEAWVSKLPVVVTNVGDLPYIVEPNKNGWIVKKEDIKDLALTLKKAINLDKVELNKMGEVNYKKVKENYTWKGVSQQILKEIEKIKK